jgi:hypothetical protein
MVAQVVQEAVVLLAQEFLETVLTAQQTQVVVVVVLTLEALPYMVAMVVLE